MRIGVLFLTAVFVTSCSGEINQITKRGSGLYCYGNPDLGGVICVPEDQVWSCESLPNGEVKCTHTPDGQSGWTCVPNGDEVTCTKQTPGVMGGAGWSCISNATSTTCTSVSGGADSFSPPGAGDVNCALDDVGVVCSGSSDDFQSGDNNQSDVGGDEQVVPPRGDFRTQTPGGWGAPAAGNNAGAYRDAHFADAFPDGLTIGCEGGHTATFTSAKAIEIFLPAGSTPGVLDADSVDPETTSAGVLAGHVVAATLAAGFDANDDDFGASDMAIVHLVAAEGSCAGMTVGQILDVANDIVGGCSTAMSPSEITGCVDAINNNFVDGDRSNGFLLYP